MNQYFQGDICIERVEALPPSIHMQKLDDGASHVLAWGELTGHSHAVSGDVQFGRAVLNRLEELFFLYRGHLVVGDKGAVILHQEHAPIFLGRGVYRVRAQREFDERSVQPEGGRMVAD